ncbi:unnamed protein product [Ixodes hexagonus]
MALNSFHQRKGYLVTISNGNRTAQRIHPHQEFNNGIVMSAQPLRDHQLFEVRIDKKVATWSGSIEIGVTTLDPGTLTFPSSATNLREGSWVMSGTGVLQDGQPLVEEYGTDLDQLGEGDRVGVMRTSAGELQFFVNGRSQGVAASRVPPHVYVVVDLYGKCAQISIVDGATETSEGLSPFYFYVPWVCKLGALYREAHFLCCYRSEAVTRTTPGYLKGTMQSFLDRFSTCADNELRQPRSLADNIGSENVVAPYAPPGPGSSEDPLRFHVRCGALVHLSNNNRTAERRRPADEFNNGVVMTHRALRDDEWFEIRIDELVNKWSGSIELGVTTHNPDTLDFPATMTNMRSGTIMMSGSGILTNGKGSRREYGNYNLDELHEGDRIGVVRKSNGNLHYYINGMDQGMASNSVPQIVYGVVDLYGMTVKVTLLDHSDPSLSLVTSPSDESKAIKGERACPMKQFLMKKAASLTIQCSCCSRSIRISLLMKVPCHETAVFLIEGELQFGVFKFLPTSRKAPRGLFFGVYRYILKTQNPASNLRKLDWPWSSVNAKRCGTGPNANLIRSFVTLIYPGDQTGFIILLRMLEVRYSTSKDARVAGQNYLFARICVQRWHLLKPCPCMIASKLFRDDTNDRETERLLFHPRCGGRALVTNGGRTARRPSALDGFNNAVVLTNRALRADELFEVVLEQQVSKWTGSIDIGVTMFPPHLLDFPTTMTNVRSGTWIMTGCGVMHNGTEVIVDYCRNLDTLQASSLPLGLCAASRRPLHFIVHMQSFRLQHFLLIPISAKQMDGRIVRSNIRRDSPDITPSSGKQRNRVLYFSKMMWDYLVRPIFGRFRRTCVSRACAQTPRKYARVNKLEIRFRETEKASSCGASRSERRGRGSRRESRIAGGKKGSVPLPARPGHSQGDRTALFFCLFACLTFYTLPLCAVQAALAFWRTLMATLRACPACRLLPVNGNLWTFISSFFDAGVWAVVDLYGQCAQVSIVPQHRILPVLPPPIKVVATTSPDAFNACCGKNVVLRNGNKVACRTMGFNNALVFSAAPLELEELFEVQVEQVSNVWAGTLVLGLTTFAPEAGLPLPSSALRMPGHHSWLLVGSRVYMDGTLLRDNYGPSLHRLAAGERIGVQHCFDGTLHIHLNGEDLGPAASNLPKTLYAVLDLYGMLESVSLCSSSIVPGTHSAATNYYDTTELSQGSPKKERVGLELHENHGRNVRLRGGNRVACRVSGYSHGLLVSSKPLPRCQPFQVRIDRLDGKWSSSLLVGVVGENPEKLHFPLSALGLRKLSWVVCGDSVYHNGVKVKDGYGPNLDNLQQWHTVGVQVDLEGCLHMHVNGVDQGVAARDLPPVCYALVDLYGQCEQVTVIESHDQDSEPGADCREKADIENISTSCVCRALTHRSSFRTGVKEKRGKNIHNDLHAIKNCEYRNSCTRFKAMLGIPEGYFLPDLNVCYCETCHKIRGDEPYLKVGEPPRDYAVPFGWCHFPLRPQPRPDNNSVQQKWHMAFHGVPLGAVRKTLDHGELLPPDKVTLCQVPKPASRGKAENFETQTVCLSPTLRYAGSSAFCPRHEFVDPKSGRRMHARAAFQVLVQPGSYTTHPASVAVTATVAGRELIDVHFGASELEWRTKEIGATVLHALLVRLEAPS